METLKKRIAAAVRAGRRARKINQEELAAEVGLNVESLSSIERAASIPSVETYVALARALNLDTLRILTVPDRAAKISRDRMRLEADLAAAIEDLPDVSARELLEIATVLARRKKP